MPFLVRPAREEDVPALQRLFRELDLLHARLQPGFFQAPRGLPRAPQALARLLRGRDEALFVAELDEPAVAAGADGAAPGLAGLAGLIYVRVYQTPKEAALTPRRRAHIEDLVVDERLRRRGCGRALLLRAMDWARAQDAAQVVLTVWSGNSEAEAFYRRLGYQPVSTVLGVDL